LNSNTWHVISARPVNDSEANGVAAIASQTGDIGRGLNEKLYELAYQHHRGTKATPGR
jgi:hypothetical protein